MPDGAAVGVLFVAGPAAVAVTVGVAVSVAVGVFGGGGGVRVAVGAAGTVGDTGTALATAGPAGELPALTGAKTALTQKPAAKTTSAESQRNQGRVNGLVMVGRHP